MRAVFLDFGSVTRGDMDCSVLERVISTWDYYEDSTEQEIPERIKTAEVIVSNKVFLDHAALMAAANLKLICIAATGYNNIDLIAATERKIPVCNVRNYATPSVVQHVFMLILNFSRRFMDYQKLVKEGGWQRSNFFCPLDFGIEELSGKKLGIVGFGHLGQAVAQVARAFGMQILVAEHKGRLPRPDRLAFDDVMHQADFITLHCPLDSETHHLIGHREFELMKPSAFLINTARGGLINEADLLDCLSTHRIAGAAIDVLQEEPPGKNNLILQHQPKNLIITPHIAWASRESRQRLLNQVAENIDNFFHHKPFNQIRYSPSL
jgi:glycerate dehydrogenase